MWPFMAESSSLQQLRTLFSGLGQEVEKSTVPYGAVGELKRLNVIT